MIQQKANVLTKSEVAPDIFLLEIHSPELIALGQPGQFLHLRLGHGRDPLLRRPLSIFSRDREREAVGLLFRVVGRGTRLLSRLSPGEDVDLVGPLGRPFTLPPGVSTALLVAGGLGVAPLFLLAQDLIAKGVSVHVLLGARSKQLLLCRDRLRALGAEVAVSTDDGSEGRPGLVTELLEDVLHQEEWLCQKGHPRSCCLYATGPEAMMRTVASLARAHRLWAQFSLETRLACGIGACLGCVVRCRQGDGGWVYRRVCADGPVFHLEELPWD